MATRCKRRAGIKTKQAPTTYCPSVRDETAQSHLTDFTDLTDRVSPMPLSHHRWQQSHGHSACKSI